VVKVDFYISLRRKPLGSETTKCPSLAKKRVLRLEETCRLKRLTKNPTEKCRFFILTYTFIDEVAHENVKALTTFVGMK
jgi:hypothetical protein